jgi:hypothetical protein
MKSAVKSSSGPRKLDAPPDAQIATITIGAVPAVATARVPIDIVRRLR